MGFIGWVLIRLCYVISVFMFFFIIVGFNVINIIKIDVINNKWMVYYDLIV